MFSHIYFGEDKKEKRKTKYVTYVGQDARIKVAPLESYFANTYFEGPK